MRCGGIFDNNFVKNLLLNVPVKRFFKLVNIGRSIMKTWWFTVVDHSVYICMTDKEAVQQFETRIKNERKQQNQRVSLAF